MRNRLITPLLSDDRTAWSGRSPETPVTLDLQTPPKLETMSMYVDGQGAFNVGDCVSVLAWRFDEKEDRRENRWRCANV